MGTATLQRTERPRRDRPAIQRKAGCTTCCSSCAATQDDLIQTLRLADAGGRQRLVGELQGGYGNRAVQRLLQSPKIGGAGGVPATLRQGSRGPAVRQLQELLNSNGLSVGSDGAFGPKTRGAVVAFQSRAGLAADGVVGPKTWVSLKDGTTAPTSDGPSPQAVALIQAKLRMAMSLLRGAPSRPAEVNNSAGPRVGMATSIQRDWWDDVTETVGGAVDTVSEAVGGVVDTVSETVGGVVDTASETVGGIVDSLGETVGGVVDTVTGTVGQVIDSVGETVSEVVDTVSSVAEDISAELGGLADDIKQQYANEIAVLDEVVRGLGQGLQVDDKTIAWLSTLLDGLIAQFQDAGGLATNTTTADCAAEAQDVSFADASFKVDARGLGDLHAKVSKKLGGAGHVSLDAMPSMKVICEKEGPGERDPPVVGSAKVTAKGKVVMPTRGTVGTTSADADREKKGIDNYFSIVQAHERQHADIYKTAFGGAAKKLEGVPVKDAQKTFDGIVCEAFKKQDELDNAEGCMELCCSPGDDAKDASKAGASSCGLTPSAASSCP